MDSPKNKSPLSLKQLLLNGMAFCFAMVVAVCSLFVMILSLLVFCFSYPLRSKALKSVVLKFLLKHEKFFKECQSTKWQTSSKKKTRPDQPSTNNGTDIDVGAIAQPIKTEGEEIVKFQTKHGLVEGTPAEIAELIDALASRACTGPAPAAEIKTSTVSNETVAKAPQPAAQASTINEEDLLDENGNLDLSKIDVANTGPAPTPANSAEPIPAPAKPLSGSGFGA